MSIKKNSLLNLVGAIIPMLVMLVTVPLYLKFLGEARYGVLALVWLVLGYFSFLEMGLGKATANQIAKTVDAAPSEREEIFWTALSVNFVMGLVAAGILWFVGDYLISHVFKMPADFRSETYAALPWLVATFPLALVSSVLNGALEGRSQFLALNLLQIGSNSAFQIVPLLFAWLVGPSLAVVIPAAVLTRAVMNLFYLYICQRTVPLTGQPRPRRSRVKLLFTYGGWVAVTSALVPLLDTVERFIIGIVAGATAVTHYTVPMQLVGRVKVIPSALSRAMFPVLSSSDPGEGTLLAQRALYPLSVVMTLIVLVALLGLRPFLHLWLGADIARIAAPIGEILLVGVWFNSVAHVPYFLIQAHGRPDLVAKIHMVELPFYIGAAWMAMHWVGLAGVAIVWVLRCMIEAVVLLGFSGLIAGSIKTMAPQVALIGITTYVLANSSDISLLTRFSVLASLLIAAAIVLIKRLRATKESVRAVSTQDPHHLLKQGA